MKVGKYYLILATAAAILCVPVFSTVELTRPSEPVPVLLGRANQPLVGIDKLYVRIVPRGFEPNSHGLVFEELENLIIDRLKEAGITIAETDIDKMGPDAAKMLKVLKRRMEPANVKNLKFIPPRIPGLCVDMDMLVIEHLQQVVFYTQISLARLVHLEKESRLAFKTAVWQSEPIMQAVSVKDTPAAVTHVVLEQVDAFIHAYLAANPPGTGVGDVNDVNVALMIAATKRASPAEYKFVASKNSDVFHRPDCSSAKRIKPANLVGYNSRAEALKAGKRPCKRCKP